MAINPEHMKKILYILTALLLLSACGEKNSDPTKKEPTFEDKLCVEWHSHELPVDNADIYLKLNKDKTFEIYQKIGEGAHRLYRGTWNVEDNILTGVYNDGESWAAAYAAAMSDKFLTLTSQNDAAEESVFVKEEIPAEIKETCEVMVKSPYAY